MVTTDFDVAVAGAGVVGLAIARVCAQAGKRVVLLERNDGIGQETSSRNSEVIHAGLYYPRGSLKAALCVEGRTMLYDYCRSRQIPHRRCGKLIVATGAAQLPALRELIAKANANGVTDVAAIEPQAVMAMEPEVRCVGGLFSPSTGIIDSHAFMQSMLVDFEQSGGLLALRTSVLRVQHARCFQIEIVSAGTPAAITARTFVNCAGLSAPALAHATDVRRRTDIPRQYLAKGHYLAWHGAAPFRHLVYPMPNEAGLGIHATIDLADRVRFGPDVHWVEDVDYDAGTASIPDFVAAIRQYWPGVSPDRLIPDYAGVRPKLVGPGAPATDFRIDGPADHGVAGLFELFGIESPGLTASLAIAMHVLRRIETGN
jgi:L-2-hydroxyglutarate oxidase LhgO